MQQGDDKKLERERTWRKSSDSSMSLCSAPDASMCLTCADTLALREELVALRDELAAGSYRFILVYVCRHTTIWVLILVYM